MKKNERTTTKKKKKYTSVNIYFWSDIDRVFAIAVANSVPSFFLVLIFFFCCYLIFFSSHYCGCRCVDMCRFFFVLFRSHYGFACQQQCLNSTMITDNTFVTSFDFFFSLSMQKQKAKMWDGGNSEIKNRIRWTNHRSSFVCTTLYFQDALHQFVFLYLS